MKYVIDCEAAGYGSSGVQEVCSSRETARVRFCWVQRTFEIFWIWLFKSFLNIFSSYNMKTHFEDDAAVIRIQHVGLTSVCFLDLHLTSWGFLSSVSPSVRNFITSGGEEMFVWSRRNEINQLLLFDATDDFTVSLEPTRTFCFAASTALIKYQVHLKQTWQSEESNSEEMLDEVWKNKSNLQPAQQAAHPLPVIIVTVMMISIWWQPVIK